MAMDWFSANSCAAAAQFGWFVGVLTGALADIVIVILIASAPKLGTNRPSGPSPWRKARTRIRNWPLWLVGVVWILGGCHSRTFVTCYTASLAFGCALTVAVVVLLALLTAANQIGARSVR
jgi:hypothetical protein